MSETAIARSDVPVDANRQWSGRAIVALFILAGFLAPALIGGRFALTLSMQISVLGAYAYSYQLLFGRAGMLSFGHAIYFGLGAFATAHGLNSEWLRAIRFPAELVPLIGVAAGFLTAVVFGYPSTRRAGTPFAMVTLGIGELVAACFLMFPRFFGGESGISTDRTALPGWIAVNYGGVPVLYPLVLSWSCVLICTALWVAYTPLGLLARAVRDNPERVSFLGFTPATIRFKVMLISGSLAGGAGALAAMLYEIVSVESVSLGMSANVLLMTVVGGAASMVGPLVGSVTLNLMQSALSMVTHAWALYYGLAFVLVVLFAPGGLTMVVARAAAQWRRLGAVGFLGRFSPRAAVTSVAIASGIVLIEVVFARPDAAPAALGIPRLGALAAGLAGLASSFWLLLRARMRP